MQFFTYKMKQMADGGHVPSQWPSAVVQNGIIVGSNLLMGACNGEIDQVFGGNDIGVFSIQEISSEQALANASVAGMRSPEIGVHGIYDADPIR